MKTTIALLAVLAFTGCASRKYVKHPDGSVELKSTTFLVSSRVSAVAVTPSGLKVGSGESTGDEATVDAIGRAAGVAAAAALKASAGMP